MSLALRWLIFDLDGTLADSRPGILQSLEHAAAAVYPGRPFNPSLISVGPPLPLLCAASFPGASADELQALARGYRAHYDAHGCLNARLYDGVREALALAATRGVEMHLATNKPAKATAAVLRALKIESHFHSVITVDAVQPPFTDKAAMIRFLLQREQIDPAAALYVGDTAEDAGAAEACGLRFVWAAYGYGKVPAGRACRAINGLAELAAIL